MGTYNPTYKSTVNLLRGLKGFISTVIVGAISAHEPLGCSYFPCTPPSTFVQVPRFVFHRGGFRV